MQVHLEAYIRDLKTFEGLVPDDWLKSSGDRSPLLECLGLIHQLRLSGGSHEKIYNYSKIKVIQFMVIQF